ncbi:multicopper oxidase family protein [Microbulbifer taiwanensis]|uniref:Multicopper oxidase family protein n=2 Tax=Microbulbifer taiwanensis TaxID=986746 RepID=A0ABW1YJ37_9GAMM|nr:multicopper oxidase domain-containing protein [Microbulbifer taiwanensis]
MYIQDSLHEFYPGRQSYAVSLSTLFHRCSYLGPTIRVKNGDLVEFSIANLRSEPVTNHWHGMHIPGAIDGGPHQMIQPGETWRFRMAVNQEAATNWYHDHTCEKTAEQVYFGHAGMFIIEDDNSEMLGLPNTYGVNDIPLILQDKLFDSAWEQQYYIEAGPVFWGDYIIANGTFNPYCRVAPGLIRFRVLNAGNNRQFGLHFRDGREFYVIAGDGGFLNNPVLVNKATVYPGERMEMVVDFSGDRGAVLDLLAETITANPADGLVDMQVMRILVNAGYPLFARVPSVLRREPIDWESAVANAPAASRSFRMSANEDSTEMYINDQAYDMHVVNESVPIGVPEVWEVSATGDHPFHVHGCSFLILDIDGKPPEMELRGWKDTVVLPLPDGNTNGRFFKAHILVEFNHPTYRYPDIESEAAVFNRDLDYHIPYMYHCHRLEHEDKGMMGQFTVYHETQ